MVGDLDGAIEQYGEAGRTAERENRQFAARAAGEPLRMGQARLVYLRLPRERQAFWEEVGGYAREAAGVELSLCHLAGRPLMVLARSGEGRMDLRPWARYVTDVLPAAAAVDARADQVALIVSGLAEDAGLAQDVLRLLAEGAHLLTY
jgi:hypothetical protein